MGGVAEEIAEVLTAFLIGGTEGFIAPVFELIISILLFTTQSVQQSVQIAFNNAPAYSGSLSFLDIGLIFSVFAAMVFLENFFTGLTGYPPYNIGYCIGAILGIVYFWNTFTTGVFKDAITNTIIAVIIIGFGVIIRLYAMALSQRG
jgi:hypothetical protein